MLPATQKQAGLQHGWYFFTLEFGPPEPGPPNVEARGQGEPLRPLAQRDGTFFRKNRNRKSDGEQSIIGDVVAVGSIA